MDLSISEQTRQGSEARHAQVVVHETICTDVTYSHDHECLHCGVTAATARGTVETVVTLLRHIT